MKKITYTLLSIMLGMSLSVSSMAQGRPGGTSSRGTRTTSIGSSNSSISKRQPATNRTGTTTRPTTSSRPTMSTRPTTNTRPATSTTKPATTTRPGTSTTRPGNSSVKPSTNNRPGTTTTRPGCSTTRPGTTANRPGTSLRPGSTVRPGSSVAKPGGWTPAKRPHNNWASPSYRPPRPGGGYWGAPAPSRYRIGYWAPPLPPRYTYAVVGVPTLGTILGLTFGSFIDNGINALYNSGYNVAGYADNVIYLTNVNQLGILWPEAAMQYTDGLFTNAQFSYWSTTPGMGRFNSVYSQLTGLYGAPIANTGSTVTWWAGDNTGYITLHYAYMNSLQGIPGYYTTLTYSAYY